jgi:hypothetical protein
MDAKRVKSKAGVPASIIKACMTIIHLPSPPILVVEATSIRPFTWGVPKDTK